jgi:hypothetical protein
MDLTATAICMQALLEAAMLRLHDCEQALAMQAPPGDQAVQMLLCNSASKQVPLPQAQKAALACAHGLQDKQGSSPKQQVNGGQLGPTPKVSQMAKAEKAVEVARALVRPQMLCDLLPIDQCFMSDDYGPSAGGANLVFLGIQQNSVPHATFLLCWFI